MRGGRRADGAVYNRAMDRLQSRPSLQAVAHTRLDVGRDRLERERAEEGDERDDERLRDLWRGWEGEIDRARVVREGRDVSLVHPPANLRRPGAATAVRRDAPGP